MTLRTATESIEAPRREQQTPKILVVDDIADNRDLLMRRLTRQSFQVSTAENGQEALDLLEAQDFDLVLLDIMMPVMNGFELLERMKSDTALMHVPVIVVSASEEEESALQCVQMGAEDYLQKPINQVLLNARIDATLRKKRWRDQELQYRRQLREEMKRSEELLQVLFPHAVMQELRANGSFQPRRYNNVAVLFCDIVSFTDYCDLHDPGEVVSHLQRLVEEFEMISKDHELEKIKTIGDAFMAAGNISAPVPDPVLHCVQCGMDMIEAAHRLPPHWNVRIGVHLGPVVAGVIGSQKYSFDIWGDTVNTAARVESYGEKGSVNVSGAAWQHIVHLCRGESRLVEVKGKGSLEIVRVKGFLDA